MPKNKIRSIVNPSVSLSYAKQIRDGDELHNLNAYEYLKGIADSIEEKNDFGIPIFRSLKKFFIEHPNYIPNYPYGDKYSRFLLRMETAVQVIARKREALREQIVTAQSNYQKQVDAAGARSGLAELWQNASQTNDSLGQQNQFFAEQAKREIDALKEKTEQQKTFFAEQIKKLNNIVNHVYANPNQSLERAAGMMSDIFDKVHHTSSAVEHTINTRMKGRKTSKLRNKFNYYFPYRNVNEVTPQDEGSLIGRLVSAFSSTYKPQTTTSLAVVRNYNYKTAEEDTYLPTEYRFGTQGQYHRGKARVSPIFEEWLRVQDEQHNPNNEDKITHVYFNNLGLDTGGYEGKRESRLSHQIHGLEARHKNIAVITIPADKGLMSKSLLFQHAKTETYESAFDEMRDIMLERSNLSVKDFKISDRVKSLLFNNDEDKENLINILIKNSFKKLGFKEGDQLSKAEKQAVYFHLMKYEFPNFVLEKLNTKSFNMSCKDAIDRGGASSAYYNLMKSIERLEPISKEEFYRALHAAPTLVKGRGMNHHTMLIWNTVNAYLNNKNNEVANELSWLKEWRDNNVPRHTQQYFINEFNKYKDSRENDARERFGFFSTYDKATKVNAVKKVLHGITNSALIELTPKEFGALNNKRLKTLCKNAVKHGLFKWSDIKVIAPVKGLNNRRPGLK